jgi:hypothetical protein
MSDTSKPTVRLAPQTALKTASKKRAVQSTEHSIKLAIRLNEGINESLRSLIRYRGDLSTMALEALNSTDLVQARVVSADEGMVRDTTITLPRSLHKKLREIARERQTSMNILVNTALAHWLARKGELRLL